MSSDTNSDDGGVREAAGSRRESPDRAPSLIYDLYRQGTGRLADGNAAGAVEVLELAVERAPSHASLHEALGRAYFAASHPRRARAQFERALELDPTDDYAHFGVGRCFEREGRLTEAAKFYKLACALAPRSEYETALERVLNRIA